MLIWAILVVLAILTLAGVISGMILAVSVLVGFAIFILAALLNS